MNRVSMFSVFLDFILELRFRFMLSDRIIEGLCDFRTKFMIFFVLIDFRIVFRFYSNGYIIL